MVGPTGPDQPTPGWWDGLIGPGRPAGHRPVLRDRRQRAGRLPGHHRAVVDARRTGGRYGSRFPRITVRDQVRGRGRAGRRAGHRRASPPCSAARWVACAPWSGRSATRTGCAGCIAIATCAYFTGDQIAWSVPQLAAIRADRRTSAAATTTTAEPPLAGMAVARQIAHTTYRSALELDTRFGRAGQGDEDPLRGGRFAVAVLPGAPRRASSAAGSTRTPTWCSPRR